MTATANDARSYATIRYRLLLADLAVSTAFLLLLQASGASHRLAGSWTSATSVFPLQLLGYLASLGALSYLATFPLHFYGSYRLEHRFGLSRQTLGAWWVREAKRVAVGALFGVLLAEGFYAALRGAPEHWPVVATAGWVACSVVVARIFPTVLLPLFYKTTPMGHEALVQRLLALCERTGLPALGVFRFDLGAETRKANAALAGLGKTRRVLLSDTLLSEFTPEEIEGVLAHELAHHRYHHLVKMLVLSACGAWIAFMLTDWAGARWSAQLGLSGVADLAGVPVLALWFSLLGLVSQPLQNGVSRYFEWQSDRFAVEITRLPRAFADALKRLAALNLADPHPPRWAVWLFYDHPPITERIRAAERAVS